MIRDVAVKVPDPQDFIADSIFPSHIIVPRCSGQGRSRSRSRGRSRSRSRTRTRTRTRSRSRSSVDRGPASQGTGGLEH